MIDKRLAKRVPFHAVIELDEVLDFNDERPIKENISIQIVDISSKGIGFLCDHEFEVGYLFNANIKIHSYNLYTTLKVVRVNENSREFNSKFTVGCEFVEIAEILSEIIYE